MCRFTFYQGRPIRISSLITEPKHSLIRQSFDAVEREEPLNGDGFGLAWYNHAIADTPALFKSVSPAWSNNNLLELSHMIESSCILAHVRAATQSLSVSEANCHPFKWGKYAFMHNGDIGGFPQLRRSFLNTLSDEAFSQVKGTTDSECFFALFQDKFRLLDSLDIYDRLATAMMHTIKKVVSLMREITPNEHAYLNMVVSDGRVALGVRFTTDKPERADSLYLNLGKKYVCEDGICYMKDPGADEKAIIISSEPLSTEPGWQQIPVNSMVLVHEGKLYNQMKIEMDW